MELQVVEGVSIGARNEFLGPSIVRLFSLVLPPRRIAVDHMKTYRKSLKGTQCKSQWMVHACRHLLEHHCQLMDVDHAGVSRTGRNDFPVVGTETVTYLLCKVIHVTTKSLKLLFIQQLRVITVLTRISGHPVVVVLICSTPHI